MESPGDLVHKDYVHNMEINSFAYVESEAIAIDENSSFVLIYSEAPIFYQKEDNVETYLPIHFYALIEKREEGFILHIDDSHVDGWYINYQSRDKDEDLESLRGEYIMCVVRHEDPVGVEVVELSFEEKLKKLQGDLEDALKIENYKDAVKIRDEIEKLKGRQE